MTTMFIHTEHFFYDRAEKFDETAYANYNEFVANITTLLMSHLENFDVIVDNIEDIVKTLLSCGCVLINNLEEDAYIERVCISLEREEDKEL